MREDCNTLVCPKPKNNKWLATTSSERGGGLLAEFQKPNLGQHLPACQPQVKPTPGITDWRPGRAWHPHLSVVALIH
eukprot:scaffold22996_cov59-Cyclotella_meneghiniana.AAC.6